MMNLKRTRRLAVLLLGLVAATTLTGCASTPNSGEVGVVRNGKAWYNPFDWLDNHKIRGIVPNGNGNTWVGMGSSVHYYPVNTQQRFFTLQSCVSDGELTPCKGADSTAITVPTADGVEVTLSGQFLFNTAFDGTARGDSLVKDFDTQYSTRKFGSKHPYEGTEGWSNWLAAIVEPTIVNNMRQVVSGLSCAELVSSCALVQNGGQQASQKAADLANGKVNQNNVQRVQDAVVKSLQADLKGNLGNDYFQNIRFNLTTVRLPNQVQDSIDKAQSAFAQVSQSQARVQQAKADAAANEERQKGYEKCPACAQIDTLKAIPSNVTTFAPGAGFSITSGK
ncbi:MAG TPA: SPFH domain-containing protein [Pyrinomonadaceae bacterium]